MHNEPGSAEDLSGCGIVDVCDDCAAIFSLCKRHLTYRETLVVWHETLNFSLTDSKWFQSCSCYFFFLQSTTNHLLVSVSYSVCVCVRRRRLFVTWKRRHRQKHELFLVSYASSFACRVARCASCHFLRVGSSFFPPPPTIRLALSFSLFCTVLQFFFLNIIVACLSVVIVVMAVCLAAKLAYCVYSTVLWTS